MAFGDHQESLYNSGQDTTPTITLASAPASGELIVLYVVGNTAGTAFSLTAGSEFTEVFEQNLSGVGETGREMLLCKVADASEPSTYTWSGGNSKWSVHARVYDGGGGAETPTLDSSDGNAGVDFAAIECDAVNGAVIPNNALSICIAAFDNNRASTNPYTSADQSFVNVIGDHIGRMSGSCDRFFTTGETFGNIVIMSSGADGGTDAPFSHHLSFTETGAGGALVAHPLLHSFAVTRAANY